MRHPEAQYLDLLEQILEHGDRRVDRTGVGTLSIFGALTRFNLADGDRAYPHHETRLLEDLGQEMLWFLTGSTNIQPLLKTTSASGPIGHWIVIARKWAP